MNRFEFFSDFCGAPHEETWELINKWPAMNWMIKSYHLSRVRTVSGLRCWVLMENMDEEWVKKLAKEYGDRIGGFLFRQTLVSLSSESHHIETSLQTLRKYADEHGLKLGLYVDTRLRHQQLIEGKWVTYCRYVDIVVVHGDALWDPYGMIHFQIYQLLLLMGMSSEKMVFPFQIPFVIPLDRLNLKGWYIRPADRSVFTQYLPCALLSHR